MIKYFFLIFLFATINSTYSQINGDKHFKWQCDSAVRKPFLLDFEKLFDETQTKKLNSLISNFEKETTIEICIVTLNENYKTEFELKESTTYIAKYFGIGKKNKNNGILIGISKQSRKIRIENGLGIKQILSDSETKKIIDDLFIPYYKKENYYQGTLNGINKLIEVVRKNYKVK